MFEAKMLSLKSSLGALKVDQVVEGITNMYMALSFGIGLSWLHTMLDVTLVSS